MGAAGAASASVSWSDGNSKFTRTVSNSTPSAGETVTVSTKFERTGGGVEWLWAVKDIHPTCLTYVSGNTSNPEIAADYTRVAGNWPVYPNISPRSQTFEFTYLVGANCARATPLMTTMHYSGGLGSGTYSDKGPTITVAKDATTTTLAPVPTSITTGQSVTLSGTVTGAAQGSTIEFYDGATKLGEGQSNAAGVATYVWTPVTAGARSLTAKFPGTATVASSQSAPQNVQVNSPVGTTATLTVPGTAVTGASVDLTVAVTPSNASGTVQFKDNGTNIGSPVTVSGGTATLPHSFSAAGSHSVTADFIAGAGFVNSSAAAQSVTVTDPDVTTSLSVTVPGSAETGTSVDLSATVTPSDAQGSVQFSVNGSPVGAAVPVASGSATLPHTFNAAGAYEVTAEFTGAAGFAGSIATAQTVTVADPDQQTSLSLSVPASAETGAEVSLSATVSPSDAQGSVQFKDNGTNIGSPVTVAGGTAILPHSFSTAGSHSVTADFIAGAGFVNSSAAAQSITVTDPDVATSLSVAVPASAETGAEVSLSATVTPSDAQGSVQFSVNGSPVGAAVPVASGSATLPHTFNAAGEYDVTAVFTGASGFTNSTASAQSIAVTDPDVATSLSVNVPASAETGAEVALSATVSPSDAQGSVQFKDNGTNIGSPVTVSGGTASLPHTFTTAGSHSVTADFIAGAGFVNSSAAAQSITVTDPDVTTSLSVTVPASAETGAEVSLSATVSPSDAQGSVQFLVDGVNVGAPQSVSGGSASLPYTFGAAGAYEVTAEFTGAAGFTASTASAQSITVTDPDVTTSLSVTVPASAETGAEVTLSATVTPSDAQGSVQFKDNGTNIGSPVTVAGGTATMPYSFSTAGSHSVTADFIAGAGFVNSSASAQSITVTDPDVTTSLSLSVPASAETGSDVSLSATVSPSDAQGSVQFKDNGVNIGSPVAVSGGTATLPHSFSTAGSHSVTADFIAGAGFVNSSAAAQSITVTDPDVATSLSVAVPASAETGAEVSLSATVTPSDAQGSVQFSVNGSPVGAAVPVASGSATLPHTFNAAGEYDVTAVFTGGAGFTNSTAVAQSIAVANPVVPDAETVTEVTVPATGETGQQVTLSASVSPAPTGGTVQFKVAGADVGTPVTVDASGNASAPYTFNAAGTFAVSAVYSGATGFVGSTSTAQSITVSDPAPVEVETQTVVGSPDAATTGVETVLSATVQAQSGTSVPSGTVQFRDNGVEIGSPVALTNGAATLEHTFTTVGTHQITAVFIPGAGFVASTSPQHPVEVSAPNPIDVPSTVEITSSQSATAGTAVTLTAQVGGASTLPGTVQFFDGGIEIGQPVQVVNGVAELVHTFDQSGPHQIYAVYSGGPGVQSSTSEVQTLDVTQSGGGDGGTDGPGSLGSLGGLRFGS
ncbi:beta strand repeat-containing protein [Prescottella defluvii]|uniref:beta strand repeat-containing protein n=1 Tax=Prescottella defluvii TaxID=1323361 RepID=UPI000691BB00|nr:Ig-like domain-containing protein [Prescottella defluvii]